MARRVAPGPGVVIDADGLAFRRWAASAGSAYLIRPDQHVAARWRAPTARDVSDALDSAVGRGGAAREALRAAGD